MKIEGVFEDESKPEVFQGLHATSKNNKLQISIIENNDTFEIHVYGIKDINGKTFESVNKYTIDPKHTNIMNVPIITMIPPTIQNKNENT
jgi:hypothetical protein